jgi:P2-related tail formation protein
MNLLPNNSTLADQQFASLIDSKSTLSFKELYVNPLSCNSSLLEHIALLKGANIENMLESEARLYLSTFTKKSVGTVGAVEDAINVCFDDAKLVEWFDDKENLKRGMFNVDVNLKNDTSLIYDDRLFSLSTRLINNAKNVRSKLDAFTLKIQSAGHVGYTSALVQDINLKNDFEFTGRASVDLSLLSASISNIALTNELKTHISMCAFEISHGVSTAVKLENDAYQNLQSEININTGFGGVMDVNLDNELIFKNEANVNLNIRGGVTWVF